MTFDSEKIKFGKEHVNIVEIELDFCGNTYGEGLCTAVGSGDSKCFNTLETTQDLPNYTFRGISTGKIDIAVNAALWYVRSSGSFLDDGFKVDHFITASGFPASGNNGTKQIIAVIASSIIVVDASGMSEELASNQEQKIVANSSKVYSFCTQRSPHPIGLSGTIPSITSLNVSPSKIDLAGGLGVRASVSISFRDHPHSDIGVDKYVSERTWIASDRGTFWTKLRSRNPNYQFRPLRVLSGYLVDGVFDAENFETRHFIIDKMDVSGGQARITAKDPLKLASNKKAQAPAPSTGALSANITAGAGSATLIPAGVGNLEYDTSGFVLIKSEVCSFTRAADVLTLTRGQKNTTAIAHSINDTVQQCLEYSGATRGQLDFIVDDLLTNFANIDSSFIPTAAWDSEVDTYLSGLLSGIIVKPMDVWKILKELSEAMPHYLWWDERQNLIQLTALKAPPTGADTLDMDSHILKNSFNVVDRPDMRVSTVFVSFGQINPTKRLNEIDNWEQTYVRVDTDSISKFGSNEVKVINSRWITNTNKAAALQLAALIGRRFSDTPRMINFSLDAKDSAVWLGQSKSVNHRDIVDFTGLPEDTVFQITSASESKNYNYEALEFVYGGALGEDEGGGDPDVDLVIISVDDQNINLRTIYNGLFPAPDASTEAKFVIQNGVVIGSTSSSNEGLDTGTWPAGAEITLQTDSGAFVVGRGGKGQHASDTPAAESGSLAVLLNHDLTLINNGVIGGGGGGGGNDTELLAPLEGECDGGGGAGNNFGLKGGGLSYTGGGSPIISNAGNGTLEAAGSGASIFSEVGEDIIDVNAGNGGSLGNAGADAGGTGGAAGDAIDKNGFTLTEDVTGDIRGAVIP